MWWWCPALSSSWTCREVFASVSAWTWMLTSLWLSALSSYLFPYFAHCLFSVNTNPILNKWLNSTKCYSILRSYPLCEMWKLFICAIKYSEISCTQKCLLSGYWLVFSLWCFTKLNHSVLVLETKGKSEWQKPQAQQGSSRDRQGQNRKWSLVQLGSVV